MNNRITEYVDGLFKDVRMSGRAIEIREELLSNMSAKYDDLVASGKSEDEAFDAVSAGVGDIDSLLGAFKTESFDPLDIERKNKNKKFLVSVSAILYIIGAALFLIVFLNDNLSDALTVLIMTSMAATAVLAFAQIKNSVSYERTDDSFVESYKEKITGSDYNSKLKRAVSSALWSFIVLGYLVVSFFTHAWHITWLIFIFGAVIQQIAGMYLSPAANRGKYASGFLWTLTAMLYLFISFTFDVWSWSWLIFIAALAVEKVLKLIEVMREER